MLKKIITLSLIFVFTSLPALAEVDESIVQKVADGEVVIDGTYLARINGHLVSCGENLNFSFIQDSTYQIQVIKNTLAVVGGAILNTYDIKVNGHFIAVGCPSAMMNTKHLILAEQ